MLRLGNVRSAGTETSEPRVTLQKNRVKFTHAALRILKAEPGDFLDVGVDNETGKFWIAKMAPAGPDGQQEGRKISKSNVLGSKTINAQLASVGADSFTLSEENTQSLFGYTWYELVPDNVQGTDPADAEQAEARAALRTEVPAEEFEAEQY